MYAAKKVQRDLLFIIHEMRASTRSEKSTQNEGKSIVY